MKLFWVALVCAAPVVLGTAAYFFGWGTGASGNYGELIAPTPVAAPALAPLRGKWVLVTFDAAACDAYCERKLYLMRQVRRAQGKDMESLERVWALTDKGKPRGEILPGIEGTHVLPLPPDGFPGSVQEHIYVIDPLGNLMLRFPRDPDPAKMIKDLQRLLKYSPRYK
jgi:hypothetical protein